jgi:NAD+ synthase (glutamine-hydrolysing)
VIPRSTIDRATERGAARGQRDSDSLPPYEALDPVLEAYVEEDRSREELLDEFDRASSSAP